MSVLEIADQVGNNIVQYVIKCNLLISIISITSFLLKFLLTGLKELCELSLMKFVCFV